MLAKGNVMVEQNINVVHDEVQHYFKINLDNHCAYLAYVELPGGVIDVYRTFVPEDLRGKGVAAELAKAVINFADEQQLKIVPSCSYMESYMKKQGKD